MSDIIVMLHYHTPTLDDLKFAHQNSKWSSTYNFMSCIINAFCEGSKHMHAYKEKKNMAYKAISGIVL